MDGLENFFISFIFSFVGSIPPGTLNLTIVQLGLENRMAIALRFAFAASAIEYPYAWIAVKFERLITSSPVITENLHLIAAVVMTVFGLISIWPAGKKPSAIKLRFANSGFRKGLLLGILNPLAIPYWIAITAYLKSQDWIEIADTGPLHAYLSGVFCGAFVLLILLAYVGKTVMRTFSDLPGLRKIPGYLLLVLGLYSFVQYWFDGA